MFDAHKLFQLNIWSHTYYIIMYVFVTDGSAIMSLEEETDYGSVGLSAGVSQEQLTQLKQDADSCITDSLLKKVHEIEVVSN